MIKFLIKGLIRDRHRSTLPMLVVAIGVFLTVFLYSWINGVVSDSINFNAKFSTGHVKIMTKAYSDLADQTPNDLALMDIEPLIQELETTYPDMDWVKRISFGGLLDVPSENGETKSQGPTIGLAMDLLSEGSIEAERLNLKKSLIKGNLPSKPREILISDELASKLEVGPGDDITLFSSTMHGSMALYNFKISGTVLFGASAMDNGTIIADIADVQAALDMENATSEILGYLPSGNYNDEKAKEITEIFNNKYIDSEDEYRPIMCRLREQAFMNAMFGKIELMKSMISFIFIIAMSLVLWNAGLIGGLRRYGEFGLRLAVGETKGHIYKTMIWESVCIGIGGSIIGTLIGILLSWLLQENGIDASSMMKGASIMMPTTYRALISPTAFYIGFIPGLFSTVLGTALSGIGIYKRNTAVLFKELEN